jgi:hypothetical protein
MEKEEGKKERDTENRKHVGRKVVCAELCFVVAAAMTESCIHAMSACASHAVFVFY